jgi:HAD superfamily hydrolase (TIGR01509 family)
MDETANVASRGGSAVNAATHQQAGGVVFDCDGVLVDTTPCWNKAFLAVARDLDVTLRPDQLADLRGAALTSATRLLSRWSRRPVQPDWVFEILRAHLVRAIDTAELVLAEGARELLREFYEKVCLGVASNSPRAVLLHILARLEITQYFAAAVSAEDVARPKPAPDPYLAACAALGVDPRVSFAVEDSEIGIRSALAAGLTVIELAGSPAPSTEERPRTALRVRSLADPRIRRLVVPPQKRDGSPFQIP